MSLRREQSLTSLDDLRLLAALAEVGSLAGAARHLGLNHASAWRRLGALETRLGVRLFERSRAGYAPTPAGEDAAATAAGVLQSLDELGRRLAGRDTRATGLVRVTTTETLVDLLMPALADLQETHPGVRVDVVTSAAFFTLTRRDADIALRPAKAAPDGLVARRLASIGVAIYAARAASRDRETSLQELAGLDWVAPDDGLSHIAPYRWIAAHVPPERIRARASSLTALRAAARAGLGAAALPCYYGDADDSLVRITPPIIDMESSLWLITHPDLRRAPRIRVVLDHLATCFVRHKALFAGEDRGRST